MQLSQFTVRTRLTLGFGAVLAVLALVVSVGILKLHDLNEVLKTDLDIGSAEIGMLSRAIGKSQGASLAMDRLILLKDEERMAVQKREFDRKMQAYRDVMDQLKKLFAEDPTTNDREQQFLAEIDRLADAAVPLVSKAARLGLANDPSASAVLLTETSPALEKWVDLIGKFRDYEVQQSIEAAADAHRTYAVARNLMLAISVAGVLLSLVIATIISRSLQRQLGGEPSYAGAIVRRIAEGDLAIDVALKSGDRSSLLHSMHTMRDKLFRSVAGIREATDHISTASAQIASGNIDLSARTEEQAASLEQTAASMTELTQTVRQNADNAKEASRLATSASDLADLGDDAMRGMVDTIDAISKSSGKISEITGVIEGIAFQTNILALNAAVEAARAGEQGKGFAVVASEVRNLAQRSASAAKEIKDLIGSSVAMIENGAGEAEKVGMTMTRVKQAIKGVSDIVREISAASEEQSEGIEQVNQAVNQMDSVTQQNAALVEEAAAAAHSLEDQATKLSEAVAAFKLSPREETFPSIAPRYTSPSSVTFEPTVSI